MFIVSKVINPKDRGLDDSYDLCNSYLVSKMNKGHSLCNSYLVTTIDTLFNISLVNII
jgi:hypothetical protein